jgi:hypothetical protein
MDYIIVNTTKGEILINIDAINTVREIQSQGVAQITLFEGPIINSTDSFESIIEKIDGNQQGNFYSAN